MGSRSGNLGPLWALWEDSTVEKRGYVYVGMVIGGMLAIVAFVIWKVR